MTKMGYKFFNCKALAVHVCLVAGEIIRLKKIAKSKRKLSDRQAKTSLKLNL